MLGQWASETVRTEPGPGCHWLARPWASSSGVLSSSQVTSSCPCKAPVAPSPTASPGHLLTGSLKEHFLLAFPTVCWPLCERRHCVHSCRCRSRTGTCVQSPVWHSALTCKTAQRAGTSESIPDTAVIGSDSATVQPLRERWVGGDFHGKTPGCGLRYQL